MVYNQIIIIIITIIIRNNNRSNMLSVIIITINNNRPPILWWLYDPFLVTLGWILLLLLKSPFWLGLWPILYRNILGQSQLIYLTFQRISHLWVGFSMIVSHENICKALHFDALKHGFPIWKSTSISSIPVPGWVGHRSASFLRPMTSAQRKQIAEEITAPTRFSELRMPWSQS